MLKISVLSSSSKAQEQSFYFLKLPLFKLKLMINPSSSKTRSWVSHLWLLAIEKPNFMNAAKLVSALSSLIMGFSRRECIQSPASVLVNNFKLMSRHSARCDDINGTFTACGGDVTFWNWQPSYRDYYYISQVTRYQKKLRDFFFLHIFTSTSSFVSIFVCFREIKAGFDTDESYNYIQHVI